MGLLACIRGCLLKAAAHESLTNADEASCDDGDSDVGSSLGQCAEKIIDDLPQLALPLRTWATNMFTTLEFVQARLCAQQCHVAIFSSSGAVACIISGASNCPDTTIDISLSSYESSPFIGRTAQQMILEDTGSLLCSLQRGGGVHPVLLTFNGEPEALPPRSLTAPVRIRTGDLLALPFSTRGRIAGALLLGWNDPSPGHDPPVAAAPATRPSPLNSNSTTRHQQQQTQADTGLAPQHPPEHQPGTGASRLLYGNDLQSLQRMAHFVLYGFFAQPDQAAYLAQVAEVLVSLPRSSNVQQLVAGALVAARDLLYFRTSLELMPVLAVTHGPAFPAALFALRDPPPVATTGAAGGAVCGGSAVLGTAATALSTGNSSIGGALGLGPGMGQGLGAGNSRGSPILGLGLEGSQGATTMTTQFGGGGGGGGGNTWLWDSNGSVPDMRTWRPGYRSADRLQVRAISASLGQTMLLEAVRHDHPHPHHTKTAGDTTTTTSLTRMSMDPATGGGGAGGPLHHAGPSSPTRLAGTSGGGNHTRAAISRHDSSGQEGHVPRRRAESSAAGEALGAYPNPNLSALHMHHHHPQQHPQQLRVLRPAFQRGSRGPASTEGGQPVAVSAAAVVSQLPSPPPPPLHPVPPQACGPPLFTRIVQDAAVLVLDTTCTYTDVQLCGRLAGMSRVGSMVVSMESPDRSPLAASASFRTLNHLMHQQSQNQRSGQHSHPHHHPHPLLIQSPFGAASGVFESLMPGSQMGMYLLSPEVLPAAVLQTVSLELESLLQILLRTLHHVLGNRLAAEWETMRAPLLGVRPALPASLNRSAEARAAAAAAAAAAGAAPATAAAAAAASVTAAAAAAAAVSGAVVANTAPPASVAGAAGPGGGGCKAVRAAVMRCPSLSHDGSTQRKRNAGDEAPQGNPQQPQQLPSPAGPPRTRSDPRVARVAGLARSSSADAAAAGGAAAAQAPLPQQLSVHLKTAILNLRSGRGPSPSGVAASAAPAPGAAALCGGGGSGGGDLGAVVAVSVHSRPQSTQPAVAEAAAHSSGAVPEPLPGSPIRRIPRIQSYARQLFMSRFATAAAPAGSAGQAAAATAAYSPPMSGTTARDVPRSGRFFSDGPHGCSASPPAQLGSNAAGSMPPAAGALANAGTGAAVAFASSKASASASGLCGGFAAAVLIDCRLPDEEVGGDGSGGGSRTLSGEDDHAAGAPRDDGDGDGDGGCKRGAASGGVGGVGGDAFCGLRGMSGGHTIVDSEEEDGTDMILTSSDSLSLSDNDDCGDEGGECGPRGSIRGCSGSDDDPRHVTLLEADDCAPVLFAALPGLQGSPSSLAFRVPRVLRMTSQPILNSMPTLVFETAAPTSALALLVDTLAASLHAAAAAATSPGGVSGAGGGVPLSLTAPPPQSASQPARDDLWGSSPAVVPEAPRLVARRSDLRVLQLLEPMGRGGQGVVLRGCWGGLQAAVKCIVQPTTATGPPSGAGHLSAGIIEAGGQRANGGSSPAGNIRAQAQSGRMRDSPVMDSPRSPAAQGAAAVAAGGPGSRLLGWQAPAEGVSAEQAAKEKRRQLRCAWELAVTPSLSHPNIVQAYAVFTDVVIVRFVERYKGGSQQQQQQQQQQNQKQHTRVSMRLVHSGDPSIRATVQGAPLYSALCLEFCDAGTLLSACKSGAFRTPLPPLSAPPPPPPLPTSLQRQPSSASQAAAANPTAAAAAAAEQPALPVSVDGAPSTGAGAGAGAGSSRGWGPPALVPLYTSLLEVALALRHMHSRRLVHGDIKPSNVLLKSCNRDPRGWTCKLSDFGCARLLSEADVAAGGVRQPYPSGTLPYMAPELLTAEGMQGFATDVYAFGILMWELLAGRPPYSGIDVARVAPLVVRQGLRPSFDRQAPPDLVNLASQCWARQPGSRPTAAQLVERLQIMLTRARSQSAGV